MAGAKGKSGRKEGDANRKTREIADAACRDGITPLEYMLKVLRDEGAEEGRRDKMAVEAAPYIHPKLAAVTLKGDDKAPIAIKHTFENLAEASDAYLRLVRGE
jgi:hypothetical protein